MRYTGPVSVVSQCKTGVWLRALGNGDQRRPMGRKAREAIYVFFTLPSLGQHLIRSYDFRSETFGAGS